MKKFVKEKYADIILQLCCEYKNRHSADTDRYTQAADRALETLDKYSNYILGMGYMLHMEDVPYLIRCIHSLKGQGTGFSDAVLEETAEYLKQLEYIW